MSAEAYAKYLESDTWKRLRKAAMDRDGGKCRGCGEKAENVHHDRYPNEYGREKLGWLFSVCIPCHGAIHSLVSSGTPLIAATREVLGLEKRKQKAQTRRKKTRPSKDLREQRKKTTPVRLALVAENEALRKTLADNRERRERRERRAMMNLTQGGNR